MRKKKISIVLALTPILCMLGFVGVVAVTGGSGSSYSAQLAAATDGGSPGACPPNLQFFGIRGTGEHSGYGPTIASMESALHKLDNHISASPVNYPAIDLPLPTRLDFIVPPQIGVLLWTDQLLRYRSSYRASVASGVHTLLAMYNGYENTWPGCPVVFAGYSQGADVATQAFDSLPQAARSQVILVLFGDPHFDPAQPWVDQGTYNSRLQSILVRFWGDPVHSFPRSDASHVQTWCDDGDVICNFSWSNLFDCVVGLGFNECLHQFIYRYADATSLAASWAYNVWQGMVS